jgi:hypothetical protein
MENFIIVLFKNKKKKKIIKGYVTSKNANLKYKKLIEDNNIPFEVLYESGSQCKYEIALLSKTSCNQDLFKIDEFGRNKKVFISDDSGYEIIKINDYSIEEKIFDSQLDKRIEFNYFIKKYFNSSELKVVSTLHNKLVLQIESDFYLFILKNIYDSERLISVLEDYFLSNGRKDCIFVRDIDTVQRKWLYESLEKSGFDRSKLYRQSTTFLK